ncbi:flavin reductase [Agrococcus sp. Marseille-Q4369]|uniref:flavin reductase n=1 Tax=Agrococcus sp. Marseille-Q4369 TaxID=2810513 RepID=UPI001B8D5106|nr:flavin reductase [Agrococcus sp. Marseille-Q4369]QUW17813.1 flavin reductase [Agrococcus sp. Marseille-Q4369]
MPDIRSAVLSAWEAAWDRGEVDRLDEVMTDDFVRESAASGSRTDLAGHKREILEVRAAFPDLTTTVEKLIIDGDDFAIFWSTTGTFTNDLGEVPATGTRVHTRGSNQGILRDGRIAFERVTWDQSEMLADLGVPSLRAAFDATADSIVDDLSGDFAREALKGFNRQFITGVTVVTTTDAEGRPRGLAANSYASVSLDPPLVLICVQKTSSTYPALFHSQHLGINILGTDQRDTLATFASRDPHKFASVQWHAGPKGSPLIDGSAASIEAEIKERFQAKTHTVFIARVIHADVGEAVPIVYKAGQFYDGASLTEL